MSSGEYERYVAMAATAAGAAMVLNGLMNELLPYELRDALTLYAADVVRRLRARLSSTHTVVIDEAEGLAPNQLFDAARAYLASHTGTASAACRLRASRVDDAQGILVTMDHGEETVDVHDGVTYTWRLVSRDHANSSGSSASHGSGAGHNGRRGPHGGCHRSFELSFHKKHKEQALASYLPFVVDAAKAIRDPRRPPSPLHLRHARHGRRPQAVRHGRPRALRPEEGLLPADRQGVEARVPALRPAGHRQVQPRRRHGQLPQVRHLRPRAYGGQVQLGPPQASRRHEQPLYPRR